MDHFVLAGLTVLAGWLHGDSLIDTFMAAVTLAVGAIPESLPAAMTIMLAIGVSKMAQRHAIIRRMPAVETLGSTTVICSDKTGTLTQNQRTVQEVCAGDVCYEFLGIGYVPQGEIRLGGTIIEAANHPALMECLKAGLLCNDSRLIETDGQWGIEGDPTEVALISAALKAGFSLEKLEQDHPRLDALPFESQHQYMATLHESVAEAGSVIYAKGSVESALSRCQDMYGENGMPQPLYPERIHRQVHEMAARGLRVLAFARKVSAIPGRSVTHSDITRGLTFVGLQAMMDPSRLEAVTAIRTCQKAGIQVKMITGDHVVTAAAIAHQIGLNGAAESDPDGFAMSGHSLA